MLLGLLVFVVFRPLLLGRGEAPDPAALKKRVAGVKLEWLLYLFGVAAVGVSWFMVHHQALVGWLLGGAGAVLALDVLHPAVTKLSRDERARIFAAILRIFGAIPVWVLFESAMYSLPLFSDRNCDR